jgi:hypothetical protein
MRSKTKTLQIAVGILLIAFKPGGKLFFSNPD